MKLNRNESFFRNYKRTRVQRNKGKDSMTILMTYDQDYYFNPPLERVEKDYKTHEENMESYRKRIKSHKEFFNNQVNNVTSDLEERMIMNQLIKDKTSDMVEEVHRARTTFPKE